MFDCEAIVPAVNTFRQWDPVRKEYFGRFEEAEKRVEVLRDIGITTITEHPHLQTPFGRTAVEVLRSRLLRDIRRSAVPDLVPHLLPDLTEHKDEQERDPLRANNPVRSVTVFFCWCAARGPSRVPSARRPSRRTRR